MDTAEKTTLGDVARHANVSIGTASRVLNGNPKVSVTAREAVQRAILQLEYCPDSVARSLRKNLDGDKKGIWSGNVGFIMPNTESSMLEVPFVTTMIAAVQAAVAENGYHLLISNITDNENIPNLLLDRKVEGVILFGSIDTQLCAKISSLTSVVGIGSYYDGMSIPTVNVDNRQAVINAVKELYELGHRKIAFVNKDPDHTDFTERRAAYREALLQMGLDYGAEFESIKALTKPVSTVKKAEITPPVMDELLDPLFNRQNVPTALLAANDWMAIGIYRYLQKRGLQVGRDVSVIGFDNDIRICESLFPTLTSLQYPARSLGRKAVKILLNMLKKGGEEDPHSILCPALLVVRDSCSQIKLITNN
ncbi:MAG: LacI family DNA-binding transcriptional regulator [Victivallaceae bacterium]